MTGTRVGWWWVVATLLLATALAMVSAGVARERTHAQLTAEAAADARLRASLFDSEVARFRLLPLALRDDSDVLRAIAGRPGARNVLDRKLEALARTTGASVIYLVDRSGVAIAASNWRTRYSFVGNDYHFRRYWGDALRYGEGVQFARGTVSGRAGLFLSRRTVEDAVVVVKLEFVHVEGDWARAGGETFVRDVEGLVLVTSRADWRFALTRPLGPARLAVIRADASLLPGALHPLPPPGNTATATVATAQPGWTLTLRRPAAAAERQAVRAAIVGTALAIATLSTMAWGLRQRVVLSRRRTAELEEAVAGRTAALTREMEERAAGEARAADLREGLRQANRLATLGQVTASVAHETAQPVAAIRTYAETSAALLDRGDERAVRDNLRAIARLSDRIGAVTAELRGFARRRTGELRPVRLAEVVDGALLILRDQLRAVALERPTIDPALAVTGGRVRLEQVLVNILQNALEALRDRPRPRIVMTLSLGEGRATLSIADNGPGIAPDLAARLFTPFVTSREDGLGLGLVIAHDIMTDIGGTLHHVPAPHGALFAIEMAVA